MTELNPFQQAVQDKLAKQGAPFEEAARKVAESEPSYRYSVLPLSEDAQGKVHFDPSSGIVGALKRAFTLPGEVVAGKVDPTSDEGLARTVEMATAISPGSRAVRAGQPTMVRPVAPPTGEALTQAGRAGYERAGGMGVDYHPRAVNILGETARARVNEKGLNDVLAPKTHKILDMLTEQQPAGAVAPFSGVRSARMSLRKLAQERQSDGRPTPDAAAAGRVLGHVDTFLENPPEAAVLAGPASEAGQLVKEANANYAAGLRSGKLQGIEDSAELRAEASNSGKNLDNTLRQRAATLLLSPKSRAGFNKEELKLLENVARGNFTRNRLRDVGNLLGGGGGLGSLAAGAAGAATGGAVGGPGGAAIGSLAGPAVGQLSRAAANKLTARALSKADEAVRARSPLFEQTQGAAPQEVVSPFGRALGLRALGLSAAPAVTPPTFADMVGSPRESNKRKSRR